jgi:glutamate N-acetyltransferase / amino-acid N-acetyltransferase
MLCVLTTDAPVDGPELQAALARATARTFGRITVDGCRSTNDAVIVLSTGDAPSPPSPAAFEHALTEVCGRLAEALVRDGEGATRLIRVRVTGAPTEDDALAVARAIAGSELVRTAVAGGDPNWGRILAALGAGPARVDPETVDVAFGGVTVCRDGVAHPFEPEAARAALAGDDIDLHVDLRLGREEATVLTCDLTHGYITINADYTT